MSIADLIVEDGTGLPNADSYVAIAEADQYFTDRPTHKYSTNWSGASEDNKKSTLRIATETLDNMYVFKVAKSLETQALRFPIKDGTEVPLNIKKAVIELASRALVGELLEDSDGKILESEKYDVVEFHYKTTSVVPQKIYTVVEGFLKPYIASKNCFTVELCR